MVKCPHCGKETKRCDTCGHWKMRECHNTKSVEYLYPTPRNHSCDKWDDKQ